MSMMFRQPQWSGSAALKHLVVSLGGVVAVRPKKPVVYPGLFQETA